MLFPTIVVLVDEIKKLKAIEQLFFKILGTNEEIINSMLKELIDKGRSLGQNPKMSLTNNPTWININKQADYLGWEMTALCHLQQVYRDNPMTLEFKRAIDDDNQECLIKTLYKLIGILEAFEKIQPEKQNMDYDVILRGIIDHFNACALQLKRRHDGRDTLIIKDEYDVQDLLHALLKLFFSDVRPEEWTPSYAGGCNRIDFLLKEEKIAIEVKMARDNLKDKEIGDQLIIDISKYQQHKDVRTLYCFVYDPNAFIRNPAGLENDLNTKSTDVFTVKVLVRPN